MGEVWVHTDTLAEKIEVENVKHIATVLDVSIIATEREVYTYTSTQGLAQVQVEGEFAAPIFKIDGRTRIIIVALENGQAYFTDLASAKLVPIRANNAIRVFSAGTHHNAYLVRDELPGLAMWNSD